MVNSLVMAGKFFIVFITPTVNMKIPGSIFGAAIYFLCGNLVQVCTALAATAIMGMLIAKSKLL